MPSECLARTACARAFKRITVGDEGFSSPISSVTEVSDAFDVRRLLPVLGRDFLRETARDNLRSIGDALPALVLISASFDSLDRPGSSCLALDWGTSLEDIVVVIDTQRFHECRGSRHARHDSK